MHCVHTLYRGVRVEDGEWPESILQGLLDGGDREVSMLFVGMVETGTVAVVLGESQMAKKFVTLHFKKALSFDSFFNIRVCFVFF